MKTAEMTEELALSGVCVCILDAACLHEGHCCVRAWKPEVAATYCHEDAILAAYPNGASSKEATR